MDNAGRRIIHARATCRGAGKDRQAPSPDGDDRIGLSKILRRSRHVPPGLSRMDVRRPAFPQQASPNPSPRRRRENGLYGAATDRASPTWGRIGEEIVLRCGECREDRCRQRRPAGLRRRQHPAPGGAVRGRTGRTGCAHAGGAGKERTANSAVRGQAENVRRAHSEPLDLRPGKEPPQRRSSFSAPCGSVVL